MGWAVETSSEFDSWIESLPRADQRRVAAAGRYLEDMGPNAGRPIVDRIKGSRYQNLKELRVPGSSIRVLFIFDPSRTAYLLLGGDKRGHWDTWYRTAIPMAERIYERRLADLQRRE